MIHQWYSSMKVLGYVLCNLKLSQENILSEEEIYRFP